jgi:type I restriction enzyme R subunit
MTIITEDRYEQDALKHLEALGYEILHGPDIGPDTDSPLRESWDSPFLDPILLEQAIRLNAALPRQAVEEALATLKQADAIDPVSRNHKVYRWLRDGLKVTFQTAGEERTEFVRLIDVHQPEANRFQAVNQFTLRGPKQPRRPDVVLFVNGIPLMVFELKNPVDDKADAWAAWRQIQTYKEEIPQLFETNLACVIADGTEARVGSMTAPREWFLNWRVIDNENDRPPGLPPLEILIRGLCRKDYLIAYFRDFVLFQRDQHTSKIIAQYHQFHGVRAAVARTIEAAQPDGDKKGGVFWHTQGSGKSLSATFYAGILMEHPRMKNPTIVVVTDRNDLDGQLFRTFGQAADLLGEEPEQAESRDDLKTLLDQRASGGIVFTTIQKFSPDDRGGEYPILTDRHNVVVISDEAHRSQYGLQARFVQGKDDERGKVVWGYAKYLRDALPNATMLGLTGTPISTDERDTRAVFGDEVSIYDIEDAQTDGATVPIYYESRMIPLEGQFDPEVLDEDVDEATEGLELETANRERSKWAQLEALATTDERLDRLADDLLAHLDKRLATLEGKAMMVCMSRQACVHLYDKIIERRPDWHSNDSSTGVVKVIMTASASDPAEFRAHHTSKPQKDAIGARLRDPDDALKLVLVRDMWLTGFDAPPLHTLYIDKPMKGANLMLAIARVNRVFRDKPSGLVVDYIGIAPQLKAAIGEYTRSAGKGQPVIDVSQAVLLVTEKVEILRKMLHGVDYADFREDPFRRMQQAMDHIAELGKRQGAEQNDVKHNPAIKDYVTHATVLAKAQAMAGADDRVAELAEEIGFLLGVRALLVKYTGTRASQTREDRELALRQLLSEAVVAGEVVDVQKLAGIDRPDISILSDEFLEDVRKMPQRNLAAELLERLLEDKITLRGKTNIQQEKKYSELLDKALTKYRNRSIETAQVIEELISIARQMREDGPPEGMSEDEFAFYGALLWNEEEIRAGITDDELKKLAAELTRQIRESVTIDWTRRKSARAKIMRKVKVLLRRYKYPPEGQEEALEYVLKQAELLADQWSGDP